MLADKPRVSTIYKCSCWSEGLEIEQDDEFVNICMWSVGTGPLTRSFKDRIRWAWQCLTKQKYHTDECMLSPETAREMAAGLIKAAEKAEAYRSAERVSTN